MDEANRSTSELADQGIAGRDELPPIPEIRVKLPKVVKSKDELKGEEMRKRGIAYTVPTALVAPIVMMSCIGLWLDGRYHTGSSFTAGGFILGLVVGFLNMIRLVQQLNR